MADPIDNLVLLGVSHRTAPVDVRERLSRIGEDLQAAIRSLKSLPGINEGMVLSTCNRVELYGTGAPADRAASSLRSFLLRGEVVESHLYERRGEEAVRHLFRVASSLDSMVVGEPQILGQLKEAFQAAAQAGAAGDCLHRTVGRAFAVAKRVRTETDVGRAAVSMSFAAVELARKIFASLEGKSVLLVGAGEMATLAARHLASHGVRRIAVANRTLAHAEELREELSTSGVSPTAHELSELPVLLAEVDIVVSAVAAPEPLIGRPLVGKAVKARRFRPLFLVDLAVPRSVDPEVARLPNVYVKDVDDIGEVVAQNSEARAQEATRAERIVEVEVRELARVLRGRAAAPVLGELRRFADEIAQAEARRTLQHLGAALDDAQRESVQAMARAIVNKLLHEPTTRLRRAAELGAEGGLADATARLFGLGEETESVSPHPVPLPVVPGEEGREAAPSPAEQGRVGAADPREREP